MARNAADHGDAVWGGMQIILKGGIKMNRDKNPCRHCVVRERIVTTAAYAAAAFLMIIVFLQVIGVLR